MDDLLLTFNAAACVLLAAVATWAVLSPRVRDGIVVKLGLILAVQGFAGLGAALAMGLPVIVWVRALALLHAGLLVVAAGVWWRFRQARGARRRASDWMDLEDARRGEPCSNC